MIWCSCGELIAEEVGDGFLVINRDEKRWMRRRADRIRCPSCAAIFDLGELTQLVSAQERPA